MDHSKTGKRLVKYVPDYVVFDLETTGTSYVNDSIIEISAVKVKNAQITDTFSALINPERLIPYAASQVNGITDDMVADAPLITGILPEFLKFAGDSVLVGHNIQSFDLKFLHQALQTYPAGTLENDYIDTLYMARQCLPMLPHHRLTDLAVYFDIDCTGAHRALNDCMMTQKCYEKMAEIQNNMSLEICPSCGGELIKRKGRYGEFYGCSNYPKCRYTRNVQK